MQMAMISPPDSRKGPCLSHQMIWFWWFVVFSPNSLGLQKALPLGRTCFRYFSDRIKFHHRWDILGSVEHRGACPHNLRAVPTSSVPWQWSRPSCGPRSMAHWNNMATWQHGIDTKKHTTRRHSAWKFSYAFHASPAAQSCNVVGTGRYLSRLSREVICSSVPCESWPKWMNKLYIYTYVLN